MAEDVTVHVRSLVYPAGAAIGGAYVGLHNPITTAYVTSGITGAAGNVVFPALAAGDYELRFNLNRPGAVTNGSVQTITVEDPVITTNTFDIEASIAVVPISPDARLCRVSGYVVDLFGRPRKSTVLHFSEDCLPHMNYYSGGVVKTIIPDGQSVTSDSNGYVVVDLIRKGKYGVTVTGFNSYTFKVEVPDTSSADVGDILFPLVGSVEYSQNGATITPVTAPELSVSNNTTTEVGIKVLLRSGTVSSIDNVVFTSSDVGNLILSKAGDTLSVEVVNAGTYTVSVSRADYEVTGTSVVEEPDLIADLIINAT